MGVTLKTFSHSNSNVKVKVETSKKKTALNPFFLKEDLKPLTKEQVQSLRLGAYAFVY
jgi:hypothetical protein